MSIPLLHGGVFRLSTNPKEPPSSSLGMAPDEDEEHGSLLGDNIFDMEQEADNEGDGEKDPTSDETLPDPSKLELLQEIIDPAAHNRPPPAPKSGDKRGPSHLDSSSASSDSSVEDLDAKGARPKKKWLTPTNAPVGHPSQWAEEDSDSGRIWAPWDDGLVGPALKRCPESGEDAATQRLYWHKLLPLLHVLLDKQQDFEQPCV